MTFVAVGKKLFDFSCNQRKYFLTSDMDVGYIVLVALMWNNVIHYVLSVILSTYRPIQLLLTLLKVLKVTKII